MGVAAYNRGSRAIRAAFDREAEARRVRRVPAICHGIMRNGPEKRFARCDACGALDWEANEGDRCTTRGT